MDIITILLVNGYFLSFLFIVLLIFLSAKNGRKRPRTKIKEDIKKIKEQIEKD